MNMTEDVNMTEFDRDSIIADVLAQAPQTAPLFKAIGMHCLGCAMSSGETLEEACDVHGVDTDDFIEQLNDFVRSIQE